jgi:hypothetical protein
MFRSFKLKFGLYSVVLSGVLLLGFSLFFLQMIHRIGLDRTDREMRALVESNIRRTQPRNHWARFDGSMKTLYGDSVGQQFVLKVVDNSNEVLFTSPQWPDEVSGLKFPAPVKVRTESPADENRPRPFDQPQRQRPVAPPPLEISGPEYATVGNWRLMAIRNQDVTLFLGVSFWR